VRGSLWTDSGFCGVGGGNDASSGPDRIRWQYTGRIVQHTGSTYTVEIEWQRDGGSYASVPKTTQQFVLQIGAPQVLDTLTPPSANACGVTSVHVEAAMIPFSQFYSVGPKWPGGFGGGRGRGIGAGTAGAGVGAAAGGFGGPGTATGGAGRGRATGGTVNGA